MPEDQHETVEPPAEDGITRLNALISDSGVNIDLAADVRWKNCKFVVKEVNDDGTFEGYASVWAVIDSDGEVVDRGSCVRSLKNNPNFVLLWQHQVREPVGFCVSAVEDEYGLKLRGELMLDCEAGRYAYAFLKKAQKLKGKAGLSIGFRSIKDKWTEDEKTHKSIRHFTEIQLLEISIVTWASNPNAFVSAVKSKFLASHKDSEMNFSELFPGFEQEAVSDDLYLANVLRSKAGAKTKDVDGQPHEAHDFAWIGDPNNPESWSLPIFDEKHARLAWDMFERTGGIPASEKPKVLARIRAACVKFGITMNDSGKSAEDAETTKMMTESDSTTTPAAAGVPIDYDAMLDQKRKERELRKDRSDIDNALYDTLSAIHGSQMDDESKKDMIGDCYTKHAKAMTAHHIQMHFGGKKSFDSEIERKAVGEIETKAKGKVSAAAKAVLQHALDLHSSALDLHGKAMRLVKDAFDGDGGMGDSLETEMGSMSDKTPVEEKAQETTDEKLVDNSAPIDSAKVQSESGDSGTHSLVTDLLQSAKSRLESIRSNG